MQWFVALVALVAFLLIFPNIIRFVKSRKRGSVGAVMLVLGLAFSSFLDPAKKAATENIEKMKELGEQEGHGEGEHP